MLSKERGIQLPPVHGLIRSGGVRGVDIIPYAGNAAKSETRTRGDIFRGRMALATGRTGAFAQAGPGYTMPLCQPF